MSVAEGRFLYGTSSWSTPGWVGPFYPAGMKPGEFLSFYATRFKTVEADNTYYSVPARELVYGWKFKTPLDFVLSAKFPRSIVHGGEKEKPDSARVLVPDAVAWDTEQFLTAMSILGPKCGPLILQFPYFNRSAFPNLGAFLDRLDPFLEKLPRDFRYGVEVRNKDWYRPEMLDVLRRHRAALVLVDIAYMPHPSEFAGELDLVTTDFTYVRLIGDRKAVEAQTKTFDRIVLDQRARLNRWAELFRDMFPRVRETYAYANNHYAGYAPETIRELARRVREQ